jgi:hypothetical protein
VVHAPTGVPWSFGERPSYVASRVEPFGGGEAQSLPLLVRRYLEAFGPASAADIGRFTMIPQPPVKAALGVLAADLATYEGPDGKQLHDVRGGPLPPEDSPAPPRLLPMWDNLLLAYKDRARVIPEACRKRVIQHNGDTLPTVLVDGAVAGVWRPAPGRAAAIAVTAFHPLDATTWGELGAEARSLVAADRPAGDLSWPKRLSAARHGLSGPTPRGRAAMPAVQPPTYSAHPIPAA